MESKTVEGSGMNLNRIEDVRDMLEQTNQELRDMDNNVYPYLGLRYEVSEEVLRESYRQTMLVQKRKLEERLTILEGARQ